MPRYAPTAPRSPRPSAGQELSDCTPGWVPVSGGCLGFFPWELSWSRAEVRGCRARCGRQLGSAALGGRVTASWGHPRTGTLSKGSLPSPDRLPPLWHCCSAPRQSTQGCQAPRVPTSPQPRHCSHRPPPGEVGAGVTLPSLLQAFCRRFGSGTHLASVHSEEELQAVVDLLFSSRSSDASEEELDEEVWIGLHRPPRSRSWQWSDGTAVAYNSWHRAALSRRRACAALQDSTGEPGTGAPPPAAPPPATPPPCAALTEPRSLVAMAGAVLGWLVHAHTDTCTHMGVLCEHTCMLPT
ncbi:uncharacterized protein LOC121060692 [Cygnus olor]|uniref:uncharacterized protein LOC121060692 n=1 Tax=Cygnus olor TaxID=8869 RepID=UPI001ADE9BC0|nr:uncharacterized protein LOC121060692 [Cygnus olor]